MSAEDAVTAAANIGYAIATIKAFTEHPGVSMEQINQALGRLDETLEIVQNRMEQPRG